MYITGGDWEKWSREVGKQGGWVHPNYSIPEWHRLSLGVSGSNFNTQCGAQIQRLTMNVAHLTMHCAWNLFFPVTFHPASSRQEMLTISIMLRMKEKSILIPWTQAQDMKLWWVVSTKKIRLSNTIGNTVKLKKQYEKKKHKYFVHKTIYYKIPL